MLLRLILIGALLFGGYYLASGAILTAQTVLSSTFSWMYEDY